MIKMNVFVNPDYNYDLLLAKQMAITAVKEVAGINLEPSRIHIPPMSFISFYFDVDDKEFRAYRKTGDEGVEASTIFLKKFLDSERYTPPYPFGTVMFYPAAKKLKLFPEMRAKKKRLGYVKERAGRLDYVYDKDAKYIVFTYDTNIVGYYVFGIPVERLDDQYMSFVLEPLSVTWNALTGKQNGLVAKEVSRFTDYGDGLRTFYNWLMMNEAKQLLDRFSGVSP